jgi:TolA-binding protein
MKLTDFTASFVGPCVTLVFVAGGGWYTLDAVAQETHELSDKVEQVETRLTEQDVLQVKVEQVQTRLEKMEQLLEKTIEIQQRQMTNQAAICQATNARCR